MAGGPHDGAHCRSVLLPDTVAEADALGTFAPVCDALERLIREQPGGRTIGIKGEWGSGKSTLVSFLEKRFQRDDDIRFVVFDAWINEGAPQRHAFLETLVDQCASWFTEKQRVDWRKSLDKLSGRLVETKITTKTKLTLRGNLLAASVLIIPLGVKLFEVAYPSIAPGITGRPNWAAILGVALATLPIWVYALLRLFSNRGDALSLILDRGPREEDATQSRDPDPTAIEFQRAYLAFLTTITEGHPRRRLVLVVDNLDRVSQVQAQKVWGTLQSFFALPKAAADKVEQVWLLVPYAADSMESWAQRKASARDAQRSFLDKSLQAVFEVPVPVMSNWRQHLLDMLRTALPDHDRSEFDKVFRVYARRLGAEQHEPTPRDLRLFVNQIATLHLQHGDAYPLPHLALYAVLLRTGKRPLQEFRGAEWPDREETWLLGESLAENIAAICYGTDVDQARQRLFRAPMVTAINNKNPEALEWIFKQTGAIDVFAFVVGEQAKMAADGATSVGLARLASTVAASGVLESEAVSGETKARIVDAIAGSLRFFDRWEFGEDLVDGMPAALRMIASPPHTLEAFKTFMRSAKVLSEGSNIVRDAVNSFNVRLFLSLADLMDQEGLSAEYSAGLDLCGDVTDLTSTVTVLASTAADRVHLFHLPPRAVGPYLTKLTEKAPDRTELLAVLRLARKLGANSDTREFASALAGRLTETPDQPDLGLHRMVELLLECRADSNHKKVLSQLSSEYIFIRLFSAWRREGNDEAAALALAAQVCGHQKLRIGPKAGIPGQATDDLMTLTSEQVPSLAEKLARTIMAFGAERDLKACHEASPAFRPFLDGALKALGT